MQTSKQSTGSVRSLVVTAVTAGGGNDTPQANHSATMPPQASMARSDTAFAGAASGADSSGAGDSIGATAGSAEQQAFAALQQEARARAGGAATRRLSAAITPGATLWARAQASVSAGVWQQQVVKHCLAVAHPQALSMQGNGVERSFAASRLAAAAVGGDAGAASGNGTPETIRP